MQFGFHVVSDAVLVFRGRNLGSPLRCAHVTLASLWSDDLLVSSALTARLDNMDWQKRVARGRSGDTHAEPGHGAGHAVRRAWIIHEAL